MEVAALCIRLLLNVLWLLAQVQDSSAQKSAGSVILESPILPVMEGDDVTLRCRNKVPSFDLSADFYKDNVLIRSSDTGNMTIHSVSKSDAGLYKCNMPAEGESAGIWLSVSAGVVILESPDHPVTEGQSVTLRCRNKKTSTNHIADFYRYGLHTGTGYNGEMTIHSVSKSDEGPYKCRLSGAGESAESWLTVRVVAVILVAPVLPVLEGEAVTLHCMNMVTSNVTADFYKDGLFIGRSSNGNVTLHTVSRSDEGLYKCSISGAGESAESRLTVRGTVSLCSDQLPVLLYLLIRTIATILWMALMLLVMRKHCCGTQR
ncbi:low affinity immunoglobulin gamma Fc region receptor III-A-like [Trachinotus anak]|uniref:low affinity immunoglobulin gamma Fc region receptor III-A-like n=1 Tax=Trachinotus anak TaxID=443729 RepID=UPI0039F2441C